ncbi:hypothetical protein K9B35_12890 [Sphingomonas sp. R647]|uniref:hypothetical protein n=1 Tax=Sphingomonas sp. R647 TaxID=2875233 RepID=UPI001CD5AE77|nr:hypothetical protein [Sphingomonas sp. R647]MCA1198866.1 hypothetical protein [Sphingomonas sp. R647]
MEEELIEEGFWRRFEEEQSTLPWPIPDTGWNGRSEFLIKLAALEAAGPYMDWMGFSCCRLCGKVNGASDYRAERWTWPEGYRHYIADHLIRPSREFEEFVLGVQSTSA